MIKWRPWPPLLSKKLEVKLVVKRLDGWRSAGAGDDPANPDENKENEKMVVEIRWKGLKIGLTSFAGRSRKTSLKRVPFKTVSYSGMRSFSVCALCLVIRIICFILGTSLLLFLM